MPSEYEIVSVAQRLSLLAPLVRPFSPVSWQLPLSCSLVVILKAIPTTAPRRTSVRPASSVPSNGPTNQLCDPPQV